MPKGYISVAVMWLLATYVGLLLWDEATILSVAREDGPFETAGAIFFLIASLLCWFAYTRDLAGSRIFGLRTKRNIFFLALGAVFFLAFGEEINWGQRMFQFDTPETIRSINVQQEFNIHNLVWFDSREIDGVEKTGIAAILTIHKMFDLFWITVFFLLPLLASRIQRLAVYLRALNFPLVPASVAALFLFNFVLSQVIQLFLPAELSHSRVEVKEHNLAFLFVVAGLWFVRVSRQRDLG